MSEHQHQAGDDYVLKTAQLIRAHEQRLAEIGFVRRGRRGALPPAQQPAPGAFNVLSWIGLDSSAQRAKPLVLSMDTHHLFYLLMRCEALGVNVGSLDIQFESPFRPTSYISNYNPRDKSDTISIASFRSTFSTISKLSLGAGWWGRAEPPAIENEVKYIYSAFTKLPALSLHKPGARIIAELAHDPPTDSALPLDAFKSLQSLECVEVDPMTILGWDRLAIGLRTLTVKRSGLEDFTDLFIDAVLDDEARREGRPVNDRRRKLRNSRPRTLRSRHASFVGRGVPQAVQEEADPEEQTESPVHDKPTAEDAPRPPLSSVKWAYLKHLCLADNALTFFPAAPLQYLTSLTHLDLSSNLLVSVPAGLSQLYNLVSLNLADNMIESVLGIYTMMGQVLTLNLSANRLESLCGLERLAALERVDLRNNRVDESAEVGRLSLLPNIAEVYVEGNPFYDKEPDARVRCFEYFAREGKSVLLDGSPPGFYERRQLTVRPPEEPKRMSIAVSPPVFAVGGSASSPALLPVVVTSAPGSPPPTKSSSPAPAPALAGHPKAKRRKHMRIVDLDGAGEDTSGTDTTDAHSQRKTKHARGRSEAQPPAAPEEAEDALPDMPVRTGSMTIGRNARGRHSRYGTDAFAGASSPPLPAPPLPAGVRNKPGGSPGLATISASVSKSAARRARVSASFFEPGPGEVEPGSSPVANDADAFRAKIEALRNEVGDSWLKVLAQSQFSPGSNGSASGGGTPAATPTPGA